MSKRRADHEAGECPHTHPYKETSLIVEAFSRKFGRVALLARGARRPRSAMRGVLLSFQALSLSWSASTELGTLLRAEWSDALRPLRGRCLMCGFYLNELLLRLLPRDDPHEALFDLYAESLKDLSASNNYQPILRRFEKRMLAELGYAPTCDGDAGSGPSDPNRLYAYAPERGPTAVNGPRAALPVVRG